jgi:anti-sigma regulatory factor (Ser/Thr protein kinase)
MRTHSRTPVIESSQPGGVRYLVRELADRAGFTETDSYRAGLIATELATNLVKHAQEGEMLMCMSAADSVGLELLAIDRGPGMDVAASLVDGRSTAGTSGIGLGSVRRMADEFDVYSTASHGTVVLARIRPKSDASRRTGFAVAGVSLPKAGEIECGDAWTLASRPDGVLALVADGLGHGPFAAEAANAAVRTVTGSPYPSCTAALRAVHEAIRHTRGAAAAVAEVSLTERVVKFAGVGNIGAAVVANDGVRQAVSHNGTLGRDTPMVREYTYSWPAQGLLVMHSDGLISHWSLDRYPGLRMRHPAVIAGVLYRDYNRGRDDVTVLVGREAA